MPATIYRIDPDTGEAFKLDTYQTEAEAKNKVTRFNALNRTITYKGEDVTYLYIYRVHE